MSYNKMKVGIITLGCKVNQYESEAIAELLEKYGFEISDAKKKCDAYVINTCTVTAESDRKARQIIRRASSKNPKAFILVCGCYSQTSPSAIASINGIDYICGTANKLSVADKLCELSSIETKNETPEINISDLQNCAFEKMSITKFDRTRAYVKIQDGCESKCSYCAIPAARGKVRSKPFEEVLCEVKGLISSGCMEIVLTGIETGSYGCDLGKEHSLASLLCEIDKISNGCRIRLGSLDPSVIKNDFIERIKDLPSLTHHFHISMQSGSSKILALMRRKYNSEQAMASIERLRRAFPDLQLTTDFIVGFPGEQEEDFEKTCDFARRAGFLMMHVFPYSKREGTLAAEMKEQIPDIIKKQRVAHLSEIGRKMRKEILDSLCDKNQITEVLFETFDGEFCYGHNSEFVEIKVSSPCDLRSSIKKVMLLSNDGNICEGQLV